MWPRGSTSAFAFTFDFDAEEVWIGDDPKNATRPGVLSQGTYGAKVAVPAILDMLGRHEVRATFFVPGRVAERHPDRVRAIVDAGHELAHHGYTHTSPTLLSRREEQTELQRGLEALNQFGVEIRGYRSPSWDFSEHTLELLTEAGLAYSSNLMDDIRPYLHEGYPIVELPVHWTLDDAAHFWFNLENWTKKIASPTEVRDIWEGEFLGIRAMGGVCVLALHPQVIGRPGRLAMLDEFISFVKQHDDVWVTSCTELADRARQQPVTPDGPGSGSASTAG
jgi:peptidoglycan-N-acetylglucosamine deacetylase